MNFFEQLLEAADNFFQGRVRNKELELRLQDDLQRRQREEEDRKHLLWQREREKLNAGRADDAFFFQQLDADLAPFVEVKTREKIGELAQRVAELQGRLQGKKWTDRIPNFEEKVKNLRVGYRILFGKKGEEFIDNILKGDIVSQIADPNNRPKVEMLLKYLYGEDAGQAQLEELYALEKDIRFHRTNMLEELDQYIQAAENEILNRLAQQGVNINDERIRTFVRSRIQRIREQIGMWGANQYRAYLENRYLLEPLSLLASPTSPPTAPQTPPQGGGR